MSYDYDALIGEFVYAERFDGEDTLTCSACDREFPGELLDVEIFALGRQHVCKACRVWCECGDALVVEEGDLCDACQQERVEEAGRKAVA